METFTTKDLVQFGNYLLSDNRKKTFSGKAKKEKLKEVHHNDIENFKLLST